MSGREITVAVDAMGGDHAPEAMVEGARRAWHEHGVRVVLAGPHEVLAPLVGQIDGIVIQQASQQISMEDLPVDAARRMRDSSMHACARLVRDGRADAWLSAGNTGAILATSMVVLGRIRGVERPALGAAIPNAVGGNSYLIDVGANVDVRPQTLLQFAQIGVLFVQQLLDISRPTVGLLSNGSEPAKGSQQVRAAHELLACSGLNFVGNLEGQDLFSGRADIIVADGFVANVAVKAAEGVVELLGQTLRRELAGSLWGRLAGLLLLARLRSLRHRFDWRRHGGGLILGLNGAVVVAHGRADAEAIKHAILVARQMVERGVVAGMTAALRDR